MVTSFNEDFGSTKMTSYGKKGFTKSPCKFEKSWKNYNTHVLIFQQSHSGISHSRPSTNLQNKEIIFIIYTCDHRHSMSLFQNKPLVALDWSSKLKKKKRFLHLSNCDWGGRIIGKCSFVKEYHHKDCIPTIINFNKNFVCIIFPIIFACFAGLPLWHARWDLFASHLFL